MILSRLSIRHPAVVIITTAAVIIFSLLALGSLNRGLLPEMGLPTLVVTSVYPGAGADQIQSEVTEPLENSFITIPGLKNMECQSRNSVSVMTLEFEEGTTPEELLPLVREKINLVREDLPQNLEGDPLIRTVSSSAGIPILVVNAAFPEEHPGGIEEISRRVEETVLPRLNGISGISEVRKRGMVSLITAVTLDPSALAAREISPLEVLGALGNSNQSLPAGTVTFRGAELGLQTRGRFTSLEALEQQPLGLRGEHLIRLKDVARVEIIREPPDEYTMWNGQELVTLEITRRPTADTLKTVRQVKEELSRLEAETGLVFSILKDESHLTVTAIGSVLTASGLGVILAVLVLLLFLRELRSTLIIAVSLPLSLLAALPGMFVTGQTINILSLSGMTLALGMIVDASIVMLESIHGCGDLPPPSAAEEGARRIGGAVLASATTTLSVFIPLLFLTGITGLFMKDISLTLIFCLAASTAVALTVIPFMASRMRTEKPERKKIRPSRLKQKLAEMEERFGITYRKSLEKGLANRRFLFVTAALLLVISGVALTRLGTAFLPRVDSGEIEVSWKYPRETSLAETRRRITASEELFRQVAPEITDGTITVAAGGGSGLFRLAPADERNRSVFEIIEELHRAARRLSGVEVTFFNGGIDGLVAMGTGGQGFLVALTGKDRIEVDTTARRLQRYLQEQPEVLSVTRNVNLESRSAAFELDLEVLGDLGISPLEAATAVRIFFNGLDAGTLMVEDNNGETGDQAGRVRYGRTLEELPDTLEIRLLSAWREKPLTENILNGLKLKTPGGSLAALNSLGSLEYREEPDQIFRKNRQNVIMVKAALATAETGKLARRLERDFPALSSGEVTWTLQGPGGLLAESASSLMLVLGAALFLVYAVMVVQFERFLQPLIIMASIPFTLVGIAGSLFLFGSDLSIIAFLGIIALGGVVVNNAIVLLDAMNRLRDEEGLPLKEAVLEGARSRLKPVLMTTLTTVLGVTPMAFGTGAAAEIYAPLGQVIFGGLITSTAITLILIPLIYYTVEGRKTRSMATPI
jgi:HAE1 family hydrophobic/amphiphilic exporter-1